MNIPEFRSHTHQQNIFHEARAYIALFRCSQCRMVVSAEFDEEDIDDLRNEKVVLECPCGGESHALFD